jgi:endogenous inhibitor of DNA gyrase (YacG/DUF329 family)
MPRLMITCPETGKPVYTHFNFNWTTLDSARIGEQTVQCPKCGDVHSWRREDAYLEEDGGGG